MPVGDTTQFMSGAADNTCKIWDCSTGKSKFYSEQDLVFLLFFKHWHIKSLQTTL